MRELHRDHLRAQRRLVEIESRLLDLMDERDQVMDDYHRTSLRAIAEKFEISISMVAYACRPRSGR